MDAFWALFISSLAAGVVGTGVGGALGAMFADKGSAVTARVLAFAGGVMLGVSAFQMMPEAVECFGGLQKWAGLAAIAAMIAGALTVAALSKAVERASGKGRVGAFAMAEAYERGEDGKRMTRAGVVMLIAIALHNFPEGMAIGGAGAHSLSMGVTVAIVIAVHNVPEGMAISAPLAGGGMKAGKAVALACLAGLSTVIGALIGLAAGGLGEIATGACLGASAGAMMCVTLADIFPEATALKGRLPAGYVFAGVVCAACFVYVA